jgi:signal transduction histidine kinase
MNRRSIRRRYRWSALPLRVKGTLVAITPAVPLLLIWALVGWALLRGPAGTPSPAGRSREAELGLLELSVDVARDRAAVFSGAPSPAPGARTTGGAPGDADLTVVRLAFPDADGRARVDRLEAALQRERRALEKLRSMAGPRSPESLSEESAANAAVTAAIQDVRDARVANLTALTAAAQRRSRTFLWIFFAGSVLAVGGGIWAAVRLVRGLTRRVETAVQIADEMSRDEHVEVHDLGEDEIGRLAARLHDLMRMIRAHKGELGQHIRELTAVNHELEAFSYSVSHDLRQPLRAIAGFSQVLEEEAGTALNQEARAALTRIRTAAARMGVLIDELLKLSRVTRAPLHRQDVDLTRLATDVIERLRQADPTRNVEVSVAPNLRVTGDPGLFHVALENLLSNAWKFTGRTPSARITVRAVAHDGQLGIAVADNGAGFDMAHAKMLFGAFQRLLTVQEFDGMGLGLATVQRIIRRHGGHVLAHGEVGRGATFTLVLPDEPVGGPA